MAIPTKTIRGLQDIQTHSGRVRETVIPYKAFMRLSCLEMEKFRRTKEKESAMTRVGNIDARFRAIEAEKTAILNSLKEHTGQCACAEHNEERKPETSRKTGGGFKLKY
jgi:hypothetical protein